MYNLYSRCTNKEKEFIKQMFRLYGSQFDRSNLFNLIPNSKISDFSFIQLVKELVSHRILEHDTRFWSYTRLSLTASGCLFSIINFAKEEKSIMRLFTKTDKTYHLDNSMSGMVIADLLNFLIDKKLPTFDYYKVEDSKVESLLMNLYLFQEFDSISHSLPIHIVNKQFQAHARGCIYLLLPPDSFEDFYKRNINHPQMNDENRKSWEQFRLLICNLMAGNLTDITQKADMNHSLGRYIHAYYHHLQGNLQSAIELYEDVIEHLPTKNILPANPLFAYSYALALLQDDSPRSRKKIAELLKKKDIKKAENYIPYLLLTLPGEVDENKRKKLAEIKNGEYQPLVVKLWVIILTYFDVPVDNTNIFDVNIISYNLLKLEESSVHSSCQKEYGRLSKKIGYTSLISRTHRLEEWEKVLNALNEPSLTGGKSMEETNQTETNRIIYLLEPQNLDITPVLQKSKNGLSWSKGRTISLERFGQGSMPEMNDVDRQVASCVKKNKSAYYYNSISYDMDTSQALLYLAGYPLVYLATNNDIPVEVVKGTPEMTLNRLKSGFTISLNIEADPQLINIVRENDTRIKVIALSIKQLHAVRLLASIKTLPLQAEEKLTQMLGNLNKIITIHSDLINNTADLKTEKADSRITVQLIPIGSTLKAELFVKPFTTEPPYCKAGVGAKSIVGTKDGKQVQMLRNFKKEKENYEIISGILQEISGNEDVEDSIVFKDSYSTLELLDALRAQPDITIIEWPEGARLRISHYADIDNLSLSLKKGKGNWFDIEGELNIGSNTLMTVKELLWKSRQSKGRFVQLNENEFLALSERLRKQLRELDSVASEDKGKLKVQEFASIAFDKWEEQGLALKVDKTYRALKERIAKAEEKTYDIPKQLNAELRDYQLTGFRWLARLADWGAGACLADDMGLGKTIQSIAILLHKAKEGASLVISPASVLLNWQTEISKFAPSLNILILNNAENRATMLEQADAYDVVLSTYGLLVTEGKQLAGKKWNIIILDEAHTIKNRDTKTSKAAMKLDAAFRIILTGTPIQNHLGEIWNLFQFINPGLLGSMERFSERFIQPIAQHGDKDTQKRLKKLISPFILRRTKNEVLDELPPKTEIIKEIELSEAEIAYYELLRRETADSLASGETTPLQALAEITKLRQAACNISLVNKEVQLHSSKQEAFLNIVDELITNNHRALVFSQFTSHLALIRKALEKRKIEYLYLDGSTPVMERTKLVKNFQTGIQPLFLISLKAGGLGLNLTAADYVIHLDPWWNPAIEDQASDRAHRIGQQRPVTVYRLIAKHTIEEKIIRLHATKKDMADSLLEGSNMAHKLTREELLELLK